MVIEKRIEQGFFSMCTGLLQVRNERLYRVRGFPTFEKYCQTRWGWARAHACRLINAAKVVQNLSPIGDIPKNEAQARELARLPVAQAPGSSTYHRLQERHGGGRPRRRGSAPDG
jgi:hypothetical protein